MNLSALRRQLCRERRRLSMFRYVLLIVWVASIAAVADPVSFQTPQIQVNVAPETGGFEIVDRAGAATWRSNPYHARFGEVTFTAGGQQQRADLGRCVVQASPARMTLTFHPVPENGEAWLRVTVAAPDERTLELAYEAAESLKVETVRLLDDALWVTDAERGYITVPVREGLLVPANSQLAFTHRFDTFAYEGCHMEMLGVVKNGAAALLTWHDPYIAAELRSVITNAVWVHGQQVLSPSLVLRKSAKSFRVQFVGKGDYVDLGKVYRQAAVDKGWRVPWSEKLQGHPERSQLFGTINFKLWSALDRRMNEASTKEERVTVNWTFDEAAQVAEHLKKDLQLDKVLFIMGGWIHRGYDNQHPDILPTAPECGGDEAFAACARRVRQLGYLFCLHDNYQDIYRDAPSWNEDFIMKNRDGSLTRGGHWAGGLAYLTCSPKALELARRPQNLPAVKRLCDADAYFIDTTYAAGLQECFDPRHPLTRADDMKWKQTLSDYAREVFGVFGSECGREWAIPHSDFFEGLTGVSGRSYHDAGLVSKLGATVIPLFEIVYRDCIALYGKYGYDPAQSAEYVLHHLAIGRPLHYHSVPQHLYWQEPARHAEPLGVRPGVAKITQVSPQELEATYSWEIEKTPASDWRVFVHFMDAAGNIRFQGDYEPTPPVSQWAPGQLQHGPKRLTVPPGLTGTFDVRMGLVQPNRGRRAVLLGTDEDGERSYSVGKLKVAGYKIAFIPEPAAPAKAMGDRAIYTRAHQGWADGFHPFDRFVKNTAEILSPLNELTARSPLTAHEFLTPDRQVQRTVFGEGAGAVEVIVNASRSEFRFRSSTSAAEVLLPPFGFVVSSLEYVAFNALEHGGFKYANPALFALRSLDGKPLTQSSRVRVFHGFGEPQLRFNGVSCQVERESVLSFSQ